MNYKEWEKFLSDVNNWPNSFELNEWGNCQYNNAYLIYELYLQVQYDLNQIKLSDLLKLFNIKCEPTISINEIQIHKRKVAKSYDKILTGINYELIGEVKDLIRHIHKVGKVEEMFEIYNHRGYDLWTSTMVIIKHCFNGISFDNVFESPVYVDETTHTFQKYNYQVGLMCALLKSMNIVKDDSCFSGFSV